MKYRIYFFIILLCSHLIGCTAKNQSPISKTGFYLDTIIKITLYDTKEEQLLTDGMELCKKYDALFSKTNKNSEVYNINHNPGQPISVSTETLSLIKKSIAFGDLTDGLFDVSIGKVSNLWDFTGESKQIPDTALLSEAISNVDYRKIIIHENTITIPEGMELDLGGIAKGYIGDKLKEFYIQQGVSSALLDLGGNILCIGTPPGKDSFHIGIRKPFSNGEPITDLYVKNQCVVTSGIYERYFEKDGNIYHHILNPATGYPVETDLYSVSIRCDNSMEADAISTACLMLGQEKAQKFLQQLEGITAILITNAYEIITIE